MRQVIGREGKVEVEQEGKMKGKVREVWKDRQVTERDGKVE